MTLQKFIYVTNYVVRYLDTGPPPSNDSNILILLHGIGSSSDVWIRVIPTLSKHYRLINPDIIGFGYSDKPITEYTIDFFIDFFKGFLDNLHISRASILGWSILGSDIATEFAIRFSGNNINNENIVEKLILVSPSGQMRTSSTSSMLDSYVISAQAPTYCNAYTAFRYMVHDPSFMCEYTVIDFVNIMRLPNAKYAFLSAWESLKHAPKIKGRAYRIDCPTLRVRGINDKIIPIDYLDDYNEIPQIEIEVIDNCGHIPHIEKPITFSKIVLSFLGDSYHGN